MERAPGQEEPAGAPGTLAFQRVVDGVAQLGPRSELPKQHGDLSVGGIDEHDAQLESIRNDEHDCTSVRSLTQPRSLTEDLAVTRTRADAGGPARLVVADLARQRGVGYDDWSVSHKLPTKMTGDDRLRQSAPLKRWQFVSRRDQAPFPRSGFARAQMTLLRLHGCVVSEVECRHRTPRNLSVPTVPHPRRHPWTCAHSA